MAREIEITIHPDNSVSFEVSGVIGEGCTAMTKTLRDSMTNIDETLKPEFFETEDNLTEREEC